MMNILVKRGLIQFVKLRFLSGLLTYGLACVILAGCGRFFKGEPKPHSVTISWTPSTSAVVGYYIYRAPAADGAYVKLNSAPVNATQYTDATVESGHSYAYHVTSVASNHMESRPSEEISATVPKP
jgi:fibronectin type III domain protein